MNKARWYLFYSDLASFTYTELFHQMTDDEVSEAVVALQRVSKELNAQTKKNSRKK